MKKRLLSGFLALLLLLAMGVPALGESGVSPVVTLLDSSGEAVGQGVLLGSETNLLAPAAMAEVPGLQAQAGGQVVEVQGILAQGEQACVLLIDSVGMEPLPLAAEDPAVFSVVQVLSGGELPVASTLLSRVSLQDGWGMTFRDVTNSVQPGGAMLNDQGELAGFVLGAWAELPNTQVALGADALSALLEAASANTVTAPTPDGEKEAPIDPDGQKEEPKPDGGKEAPIGPDEQKEEPKPDGGKEAPIGSDEQKEEPKPDGGNEAPIGSDEQKKEPASQEATVFLRDISLTMRGADQLEVDWAGSEIADLAADSTFAVYYGDVDSPYVWWEEAAGTETSLLVTVVPGRSYIVWVQHGHGTIDTSLELTSEEVDACIAWMDVPKANVFNKYGYKQESIALCLVADGQDPQPSSTTFTSAELSRRGQELQLFVTSTYRVKRDTSANMATTLLTPSGACYDSWGEFLFEADLDVDEWHVSLANIQDTYLEYNQEWEPGDYTIVLYLDGAKLTEYSFSVK